MREAADGEAHDLSPSGPRTLYLHVGSFKSGTSFIQSVLERNRELLHQDGVCFPTDNGKWSLQVRAVRDVLQIKHHNPSAGAWDELIETIHGSESPAAVVSMEFLSLASAAAARRIADDMDPYRIEVILTVRDLARVLPSAWQSMVKQGHMWPFAEFVEAVTSPRASDHDACRRFWHHHDVPSIVSRWSDAVGGDKFHLITVPPSGAPPSLLWERFASVIGVAPDKYDITQDRKSNFSLSYSDTELLRRVNMLLEKSISRRAQKVYSTRYLANRVLRSAADHETRAADKPPLDEPTVAWAWARSNELVRELRTRKINVVGDLDELIPERSTLGPSIEPAEEYPERAARIIAMLIKRLASLDPTMPDDLVAPSGWEDDADDLLEAD